MPLNEGPDAVTPEGVQENIERMLAEGKTPSEAVQIAYGVRLQILREEERDGQ